MPQTLKLFSNSWPLLSLKLHGRDTDRYLCTESPIKLRNLRYLLTLAATLGLRMSVDQTALKKFIEESLIVTFGKDVEAETDLFKAGFLDSYGYIEIINFVEKEYNIEFSEEDLIAPEMNSLNGILSIVSQKMGQA